MTEVTLRFRNTNLTQDLARFKCRCQQINKKLFRFQDTFTLWPNEHDVSIQGDNCGRPVTSWITVRNAATDGSFVPHLNVAECPAWQSAR